MDITQEDGPRKCMITLHEAKSGQELDEVSYENDLARYKEQRERRERAKKSEAIQFQSQSILLGRLTVILPSHCWFDGGVWTLEKSVGG